MKTKKYFIVPTLALLAIGCQDDLQEGGTTAQPGEEVTFGVTLGQNATTRTIYGTETDDEYPIYWESGDQVIITSPECGGETANGGVGSATYSVSVESDTSASGSLTKTGEIGVRWGNNDTGTFYSVYPASGAEFASDYTTVTLDMPTQQDCDIIDGKVYPNMDACFLYAKTSDVESGNTVSLNYIPLSTAIRFTLNGPSTTGDSVTISNIYFIAPEGTPISGTFEVDLSGADGETVPTMTAVSGATSNYVSVNAASSSTSGYLTLESGEKAEMNAFFLLEKDVEIASGSNDWKIQIVADGIAYTKNLNFEENTTFKSGQVNVLPDELPALNSSEWETSDWMTNLPRNVYLSEISIPGSWNSLNPDFQGDSPSIAAQYNAGARAFHIDTRWKGSWLPIFGYSITDLGVADGSRSTDGSNGRVTTGNAPTFTATLSEITSHVEDDEYMVVYCTFAQDSYDYDRENGGWEKAISDVCADNDAVIDAKTLNENSVVADVLGKVIVIVNTENVVSDLNASSGKCLFMTGMGMELDQSTYRNTDYTETTLVYGSGSTCVNALGTHAQVTATSDYTQGYNSSDRGYAPSLTERQTKAGNILSWSQSNHSADGDHDTWLYLGLGGYMVNEDGDSAVDGSYDEVASTLNNWIDGKVTEMSTTGYYPVGIVLMNFVTNYGEVMENILRLNNLYRKAYDPDRSQIDGSYLDGTSSTGIQSAASGYNSGMKDNNTNAIGWD